jgi:release factor glutamine methyltransferase
VEHRRVAFGPVLRERSDWLRRRGLLGAEGRADGDGDGDEKEELVVIRAERPR